MKRGYMVTVHLLKDAVLDRVDVLKDKTLMQVVIEYNEGKKKIVGKSVASSTYYCFDYARRLLLEFMQKVYKRDDVSLQDVFSLVCFLHELKQ